MKPTRTWYANPWLHVLLILVVAAAFRLWRLQDIPPGLFGDEATDGLDALDVLAGRGAVFFPANFGREGLHMWIVAGMFRLLGVTPLALRLPSAAAGILTALAAFWLGRELLTAYLRPPASTGPQSAIRNPQSFIPLLAALYLATSYWHLHFSRFGIRGVFTPLFGALAFAAFWRGANTAARRTPGGSPLPSLAWFALSGVFLGLAAHFYTAARFFPFFLIGFLILEWVIRAIGGQGSQAFLRRNFAGIVVMFAAAALVFAPLGVYFLEHPGSFAQRASAVSVLDAESPLVIMARAGWANILQFVIPGRGDPEQFYNLPGRSVFEPLTALLAVLGIGLAAWQWRRPPALFLLLWFPALLLPSFLATDRWPTLPRVLGVIPGVYFFPAIGLAAAAGWAARVLHRRLPSPHWLGTATAVALCTFGLGAHAFTTYRDYFQVWGPSQATFDQFEGDMTWAAGWLDAHPDAGHVYLSSDIFRHPTFMLLHEQATVRTYFDHQNPNLSWFDARAALPLPPPGQKSTYLFTNNAALDPGRAGWLPEGAQTLAFDRTEPEGARPVAADGQSGRLPSDQAFTPVPLTEKLTLTGASLGPGPDGGPELLLRWRTAGPEPAEWPGYRLEIEGLAMLPLHGFRPSEWTPGGEFLTWHRLEGIASPASLRFRLWRPRDGQPVMTPAAPDGWSDVAIP